MREDWSTLRKLMFQRMAAGGSLKEYEAEGNPVSFKTNVAKPLSGFTIPFLPVQSGTGDPSPSNVRPISGWTGLTAWRTGKNLLNPALLKDQSGWNTFGIKVKPNTQYTASTTKPKNNGLAIYFNDSAMDGGSSAHGLSNEQAVTITSTADGFVYISQRKASGDASFADFNFQIEEGSTASPYTPYVGQSYPVTFPATGKNLLNPAYRFGAGSTIRYYQSNSQEDRLHLKAGQTYVFSASVTVAQLTLYENVNTVVATAYSRPLVYTPTEDKYVWVEFFFTNSAIPEGGLSAINCQGEKGDTATAYEPYTNTVYGGTVYPLDGRMLVEWASNSLRWGDGTYRTGDENYVRKTYYGDIMFDTAGGGTGICNVGIKAWTDSIEFPHFYVGGGGLAFQVVLPTGTSEDFEFVICAKLATPYEIPLDPITIQTLLGDNVIWTDTNGSNTIKYKKKG